MRSKNIIFVQICNTYWRTCGIGNLTTRSEWPYIRIVHFTRRRVVIVLWSPAPGEARCHYVNAKSGGQRFSCAPHPACVSNHTPAARGPTSPDRQACQSVRRAQSEHVKRRGRANTRLGLLLKGRKLACDVSGWRRVEGRGRSAHPRPGVARPPPRAHLARQPHGALQQGHVQHGHAPLGRGSRRRTHRQPHRTSISFFPSVPL